MTAGLKNPKVTIGHSVGDFLMPVYGADRIICACNNKGWAGNIGEKREIGFAFCERHCLATKYVFSKIATHCFQNL